MAHIYKCTQWQSATGRWLVNDVEDLAGISGKWWVPCRLLGMKPADYIMMLKDTFHASNFSYNMEADVLLFSWEKEVDAHKYLLWINKMARNAKYMV